jgi:hypothetical protein
VLPASAQLILDATALPSTHIIERLQANLIETYPSLLSAKQSLKLITKELLHGIVETVSLFKLSNAKGV